MASPFDTIVAPITGAPPAAVAILRLSGQDSWRIAATLFTELPSEPQPRHAYYGRFANGDDGFLLLFEEGASFTGEASAELQCHGSLASVRSLLELCHREGARAAEPGEFTQRAFLNGRLDLTEAEAVRDTVEALTDAQLRAANLQREGALRIEVASLRDAVLGLLSAVEASVDFEEEIGPLDRAGTAAELERMAERVNRLLETADVGRLLRRGLRIAIVGPPNAGKSSLLNALLNSDRAIVTEIPGTTRDFVEEQVDFGGVPVVLIDTAGLRDTDDPVEAIGVQRSRAQAAGADLIWYVYDASLGLARSGLNEVAQFERPVTLVANKVDLAPAQEGSIGVSALTREGLRELVESVAPALARLDLAMPPINDRHAALLSGVKAALTEAQETLKHGRPDDLLAVHLRSAASDLGSVTGETASEDMLERIFRDFCVGK